MPLVRVTLMLPASATRPDAFISGLLDSTWPLLIPIEMVAPPPHAVFSEAICTFHAPSNVAAATGVAANIPRSTRLRLADNVLRKFPMAGVLGSGAIDLPIQFLPALGRNFHRTIGLWAIDAYREH